MSYRIAVVGVGLIGGSLSLAWKERLPRSHITGVDSPEVLKDALNRGAVDSVSTCIAEAVQDAEVVVCAVPLSAMGAVLREIARHVQPGTIVTDVGSVKEPVMSLADELFGPENTFIGGHPMAGSERQGLAGADGLLFENTTYVLCSNEWTDSESSRKLTALIEATGARVMCMDAQRHDRIAACVSHLPQLVATTLMDFAAGRSTEDSGVLQLAAGGFRDMTRIASSSFDIWAPILHSNRSHVRDALTELIDQLGQVLELLSRDAAGLGPAFDRARTARDAIPTDSKGFLRPLYDVYVYTADKPGVLAHIAGTLFERGISIKDCELLKIREGTGGAFRLSVMDESAAEAAIVALHAAGYRAHRLL